MSESRVKGVSKLPESPERWVCSECQQVTAEHLSAPSPFDENDTLTGCPNCLAVNSLESACWKCDRPGSIGTTASTEFRYINTCRDHNPERVSEGETPDRGQSSE